MLTTAKSNSWNIAKMTTKLSTTRWTRTVKRILTVLEIHISQNSDSSQSRALGHLQ